MLPVTGQANGRRRRKFARAQILSDGGVAFAGRGWRG